LVRLIVRLLPVATVMSGGSQVKPVWGKPFMVVQVAPTALPQNKPHIGTLWPSGSVMVVGCAVKLTWAKDAPAVRRRTVTASIAVFKIVLSVVDRIVLILRLKTLR
jgi:hypothetical protein